MDETVQARALAYLATHQVMTLATYGLEGVWATAVFYVNVGFNLFFLSAGHTRHAQNITAVSHIAATIQEDYKDWSAIKGIQLEGEVIQLTGTNRQQAIAYYQQKYPYVSPNNPQLATALQRVNWYRLTPTRLYFIDNSVGLGHRDVVPLTID